MAGAKEWLSKIHKNPIMRAVRCDKLIYAAMEATLKLYFRNDLLQQHVVLRMLSEPADNVRQRAQHILDQLDPAIIQKHNIRIEKSQAQFGSGALPLEKLDSYALILKSDTTSADDIAQQLRTGHPSVVTYIANDSVRLDIRTIDDSSLHALVHRLNDL